MNVKELFVVALGLSLLSSCSLYMKLKYETGRIQNEPLPKQTKYLLKNNIDTSNCFEMSQHYVNLFWEDGSYPLITTDTVGVRPIQIRTFDSLGHSKYNWSVCYGDLKYFLSDCSLFNQHVTDIDTTLSLQGLATMTDDSTKFKELMGQKNDLYIVSVWAKYLGTPCLESMQMIQSFADSSSCNVKHIKVHIGRWDD